MNFDDLEDLSLITRVRNELHHIRRSGLDYSDKYYKIIFHRGNVYCSADLEIILKAKTLEEAYLKMCKYLTENTSTSYTDICQERIEYYKNLTNQSDKDIDVPHLVQWLMNDVLSNDELWLKQVKVI